MRLCVSSKHSALFYAVAGDVRVYRKLPGRLLNDGFQKQLALRSRLVDAFAGRAADIQCLYAFVDQMPCQLPRAVRADAAVLFIAGIKRGYNSVIFFSSVHG